MDSLRLRPKRMPAIELFRVNGKTNLVGYLASDSSASNVATGYQHVQRLLLHTSSDPSDKHRPLSVRYERLARGRWREMLDTRLKNTYSRLILWSGLPSLPKICTILLHYSEHASFLSSMPSGPPPPTGFQIPRTISRCRISRSEQMGYRTPQQLR